MRLFSMVCAMFGVLGLADWMFARSFIEVAPDTSAAQSIAEPWVLYVSLFLMCLGLFFAWAASVSRPDENEILEQ